MMPKYSFTVAWSDEDESYIGLCPEFPGLSGIGDTPEEAIAELQVALEAAIETYEAEGWALPEPRVVAEYSGKVLLRMPKGLHGRLAQQAETESVSLNTLIVTLLSEASGVNAGISRVERTVTTLLRRWNTSLVQTMATLVGFRQATPVQRGQIGERERIKDMASAPSWYTNLQPMPVVSTTRSNREHIKSE